MTQPVKRAVIPKYIRNAHGYMAKRWAKWDRPLSAAILPGMKKQLPWGSCVPYLQFTWRCS